MRHDPDIVLVGEIRDLETAENAIQASLTGHLVFSTLHTNDAAGAYTRLVDMGVEPFLVASTVEGVMAQRLVRRLCPNCKESYEPTEDELPPDFPRDKLKEIGGKLYRSVGCRTCRNVGYPGRMGIYELLLTTERNPAACPRSGQQLGHYPGRGGRGHDHFARRRLAKSDLRPHHGR